jgi:hypothetical protein
VGAAGETDDPAGGRRSERGDKMSVLGSGLISVTLFAVGFGFLIPVSGWIGDLADFGGILSAIVFIGLLEGG